MRKNIIDLLMFTLTVALISCEDKNKTENNPLSGPSLKFDSTGSVRAGSVTLYGTITNSGGLLVAGKGVVYSDTTEIPTFKQLSKAATGEGTGVFNTPITGLKPRTNYKIRLFARNFKDTTYSEVISFISAPLVAKVSAATLDSLGSDLVKVSSNLTDNSLETIFDKGFVYGTAASPNIVSGQKIVVDTDSTEKAFSGTIQNLTPNKQYFIRPFVRNRGGVGYGTQLIITTKP